MLVMMLTSLISEVTLVGYRNYEESFRCSRLSTEQNANGPSSPMRRRCVNQSTGA